MLSNDVIDEIAKPFAGMGGVEQYREFANAIEREATAPLIERIKEDEALMRRALEALALVQQYGAPTLLAGATVGEALTALRQRLEAKK